MIRLILSATLLIASAISHAEKLALHSFSIEIDDGWTVEIGSQNGAQTKLYHPDGNGTLNLQSISLPIAVDAEVLRNMTNVDLSVPLTWQDWGDYSGYQYDYSEADSFYRQWWLMRETEILLVAYISNAFPNDTEIYVTDKMVNSLTPVN